MYIDTLDLQNFRTFHTAKIDFLHPDQSSDRLARSFSEPPDFV